MCPSRVPEIAQHHDVGVELDGQLLDSRRIDVIPLSMQSISILPWRQPQLRGLVDKEQRVWIGGGVIVMESLVVNLPRVSEMVKLGYK